MEPIDMRETETLYGKLCGLDFVPNHVLEIMEHLFHSGFDVWLVGGALRDFFSGQAPKDWDLATSASPSEIMRLFPRVIPVGIQHGTVRIHTAQEDIEVTTYGKPGREGILADLGRRDFTVNALALSYPEGRLLDPHGGSEDLRHHLLKTVGNARSRLNEDPLRILRAGRFLGVYGYRIHPNVSAAVKDSLAGIDGIAVERIRDEMLKLIMGKHVEKAFEWMRRCGVLRKVLPELERECRRNRRSSCPFDVYRHTLYTVHNSPFRLRVRLAALFHRLGQKTSVHGAGRRENRSLNSQASAHAAFAVMDRWRMPQQLIQDVMILVRNHIPRNALRWGGAQLRRLLAAVGPDLLEDLLDLAYADRISGNCREKSLEELNRLRSRISVQMKSRPPLHIGDLALNGTDVMQALSLKPGPLVGEILEQIHQWVLDEPGLNVRDVLIDRIQAKYGGISQNK